MKSSSPPVGQERSRLSGPQSGSVVQQPELSGGAGEGLGHGCTLSGDRQQIPSVNADLPCYHFLAGMARREDGSSFKGERDEK